MYRKINKEACFIIFQESFEIKFVKFKNGRVLLKFAHLHSTGLKMKNFYGKEEEKRVTIIIY